MEVKGGLGKMKRFEWPPERQAPEAISPSRFKPDDLTRLAV
jgi:hypothetical protein